MVNANVLPALSLDAAKASLGDGEDTARALRRRDDLLNAIAGASNCLLRREGLTTAVNGAIALIGQATGVDRVKVMTFYTTGDGLESEVFSAWTADGSGIEEEFNTRGHLPERWRIAFNSGQPVQGPTAAFPAAERQRFESDGTQSVLLLPILIDESLWGYVKFEDWARPRQWLEAETAILMAMASSIGGAVTRCQNEGNLTFSNQELTAAIERQAALTEELNRLKEAAEQASNAKSEFLANMSHEIRTPMTAILGYSDVLLEEECTPAEVAQHLNAIRQNGRHLLMLINDILDISKIEAGKMEIEEIDCSLEQVVSDVASMMRGRATDKHLGFRVVYRTAVPPQIRTDPTRLRQVLINLLGNAIKFTESGVVTLEIELIDAGSSNGARMQFTVRDSGIGMTSEQIGRLFGAFSQADTSTTRRFGGTGLGLYICKRLAGMLGGDLFVDSVYGTGSTFTLDIRVGRVEIDSLAEPKVVHDEPASRPIAKAWSHIRLAGRFLLAEDGPDNQRLISMYLRKAGADVEIVGNGKLAVERVLAEQAAGRPFSAVVMDIQMPELDGYSAVGQLRQAGVTTPVVALTAHAMSSDRAKCLSHGFTAYSTKPINRAALLEILAGLTSPVATAEPPATLPALPETPVVVESEEPVLSDMADDPDIQDLLQFYVTELPATIADLQTHLAACDKESLCGVIHRIKGTSGNYGYMPVSRLAFAVEHAVQGLSDWTQIAVQVDALARIIRRTKGYPAHKELL